MRDGGQNRQINGKKTILHTTFLTGLCCFILAGCLSLAAEPLRDIARPACSSLDADLRPPSQPVSANCRTMERDGRFDTLEIKLRAARGKAQIGPYVIDDAFLYNDSFIPEVWRLDAGDRLRVQFENHLTGDAGRLSNVHTHGLIVSPNNAGGTNPDQPLGDNIFALIESQSEKADRTRPAHHGQAGSGGHAAGNDMPARKDDHIPMIRFDRSATYEIPIPADHPSGLFWYHPHPHGMSGPQVAGGLSGLMTIGSPSDHLRLPSFNAGVEDKLLMLKDIQLSRHGREANWHVKNDINWHACINDDGSQTATVPGACLNGDSSAWLFTVNGQLNPMIEVAEDSPQVWRIANTSANVTYQLELVEVAPDGHETPLAFQVVGIDGVAIGQSAEDEKMRRKTLLMMPSARAEIYVSYDEGTGRRVPPDGARAILRQRGFRTGSKRDPAYHWPRIDLADIRFKPAKTDAFAPAPAFVAVESYSGYEGAASDSGPTDADCPRLKADEVRIVVFDVQIHDDKLQPHKDFAVPPSCETIRFDSIFYNIMGTGVSRLKDPAALEDVLSAYDAAIGMKYASSLNGTPVANRGKCFDASLDTCVAYPSTETWWIANASGETHNFHIHQTRFQVLEVLGASPGFTPNPNVYHDNYPVLIGQAIKLRIPFDRPEQVGSFVYHCHVLDHEDEGMMSAIEVRQTSR